MAQEPHLLLSVYKFRAILALPLFLTIGIKVYQPFFLGSASLVAEPLLWLLASSDPTALTADMSHIYLLAHLLYASTSTKPTYKSEVFFICSCTPSSSPVPYIHRANIATIWVSKIELTSLSSATMPIIPRTKAPETLLCVGVQFQLLPVAGSHCLILIHKAEPKSVLHLESNCTSPTYMMPSQTRSHTCSLTHSYTYSQRLHPHKLINTHRSQHALLFSFCHYQKTHFCLYEIEGLR